MKFLADTMLGKLATWLRILGYDVLYPSADDNSLLSIAKEEGRILITRDKTLSIRANRLNIKNIRIKSDRVMEQLKELSLQYDIELEPKAERCSVCNSVIEKVEDMNLLNKEYVPRRSVEEGRDFWICTGCGRVYWEGSHWKDIKKRLEMLKENMGRNKGEKV
ncbi:MAG: Mut7-C RNAse domain-containing protein [Candidatus Syntropharchaeia archaeon]